MTKINLYCYDKAGQANLECEGGRVETVRKLVTAAGGNGTAIEIINQPLNRQDYQSRGKVLEEDFETLGAEQAGFLVLDENHFEMAGGEFCGNATRSAAVLLYQEHGKEDLSFTVSGFDGTVNASVKPLTDMKFFVEAAFPGMQVKTEKVTLDDGTPASIVDLGGIVHVVIEGEFPSIEDEYSAAHRDIVARFNLGERDAVGVVWYQKSGDAVVMHPVVWVRAVDTFYYESSCGSGTIAVGRVTGVPSIVQPSEKTISADITEDGVVLKSEMEVTR